jgi:hypothetical protein
MSAASYCLGEIRPGKKTDQRSRTKGPYSDDHQSLRGEDCEAQRDHLQVGVDAAKLRPSTVRSGEKRGLKRTSDDVPRSFSRIQRDLRLDWKSLGIDRQGRDVH